MPPFALHDRRQHPIPDLILLDLVMPEVHGFDVLEWIRDRPYPLFVPVVVLTSSVNPEDERRARDLGAIAFYTKPSDVRELGQVVREIVDGWIGTGHIMAAHIWLAG